LFREEGLKYTRARFDPIPSFVRPFVARAVHKQIKRILWLQGLARYSHEEIMAAAVRDWRAVLALMTRGPYFFGDEPSGVDAIVFGTLAPTVLTPIESPIRDFLRAQPGVMAYAARMRERLFPELATAAAAEA